MELLLIAAVIALLRWVAGKMTSEEEEAPAAAPPPLPARRPRRPRATAPIAVPLQAEEEGPAARAAAASPATAPAFVVPRRVSPYARDFRDPAALRRAVVAREVLGPPLSLRGR